MDTMTIEILQGLGFSPYESKAYLALLSGKSPAGGYEIARRAGIPSSKIYETLERLAAKGAVSALEGEATTYVPVPVAVLSAQLKREAALLADSLVTQLSESKSVKDFSFWNLSGPVAVFARAIVLIAQAEKEVLLQAWFSEIEPLQEELRQAASSGVRISIIAYGDGKINLPNVRRRHGRKGGQLRRDRFFILVVDGKYSVTAVFNRSAAGSWTANPAQVYPMAEYLRVQYEKTAKLMRRMIPKLPVKLNFRHAPDD